MNVFNVVEIHPELLKSYLVCAERQSEGVCTERHREGGCAKKHKGVLAEKHKEGVLAERDIKKECCRET